MGILQRQVWINQLTCKVEHMKRKQQQVKETNDEHLESDFEHLQNNLTSTLKFIPLKIRIFFF